MKKLLIAFNLILSAGYLSAQTYESDAAQMMRNDLVGTARSLGAGGAFSTVGADMSSMSLNPAGIALYRSHEFAISGGGLWGNTSSNYLGQASSASFQKGEISQAGFVFASRKLSRYDNLSYNRGGSKLDRVVFGFGYQKLADFNRTDYFYGTNTQNSYAQTLANEINTSSSGNLSIPAINAIQTGVVDTLGSVYSPTLGSPLNQWGSVTTQGSLNELNMTLGFNVGNTVYIGAGVGVPYMHYSRTFNFNEGNMAYDSSYNSSFGYTYTGWGVNGKFGLIIKPVQWLRFGAAIQSPTVYRLHEEDFGQMQSNFGGNNVYTDNSSFYNFTYNNPLKGTFGASFYLSHWGFLSVDYELDDYGHTYYSFNDGGDGVNWNALITQDYKLASTVRAGAEFAFKGLRIRGGFAWSQSPFNNTLSTGLNSGDKYNYTAGIGYRGRVFFCDLAYVHTMYKDYYAPYSLLTGTGNDVYNTFNSNAIVATIGFKFGMRRY